MGVKIEIPQGRSDLIEFLRFHDAVYESRDAAWAAFVPLQLPILTGESPFAHDRKIRPFLARDRGRIVARAVAMVDAAYNRHWNERLGHIVWFEAMPETREATRLLMDAACEWLEQQGTEAARAGFGVLEFPFVIDEYDLLPPTGVRQNPAYYHRLLKDAGFESEKGWTDYKIEVCPELVARWQGALESALRAGYEIVPLRDLPESRRVREFTETWNEAFRAHWGFAPFTEAEYSLLFALLEPAGVLDTSVIAYANGSPVGALWVGPEISATARLKPGRVLADVEKLNFLGIGVRESARGRGVNLAMASYAFIELVRRGARVLSYTLVLDDNWPSRRTAEKLGAWACASYMVYRRNFRQR